MSQWLNERHWYVCQTTAWQTLVKIPRSFLSGCNDNIIRLEHSFHLYMWREIDLILITISDFHVKECEVDNTADTCEPCPAGSFMFDRTDSHFPFQCRRYSCPPGKMAFLFFISPSRQVKYLFDISSLIRLL